MAHPRPSTDPNSAAAFADALTAARIVDPVQLRPFASEFRATNPNGTAHEFATFLVGAGLLTEFQAERVLEGQAAKLALGPYLLAAPIGSGSLGTVYQAVNRQDRKRYAVKVLPLRSLWNVVQAKNQLATFAKLPPHPTIIPFVDVDSAAGSHYLVWPFAEGETLETRVHKRGLPPLAEATALVRNVADALAVCHANGIVHGLLKPSNILIAPDGTPRLLDLGVGAILVDNIADDESMLDTISTANAAMGMLDCCPPETINNPTVRTPAGDCYSLGCVLYFVLTGRLPFPDGNAIDKIIAHQTQAPPPASGLNPGIPARLDDLIASLMAKDPAARPSASDTATLLAKPADVAAAEIVAAAEAADAEPHAHPIPAEPGVTEPGVSGSDFDVPPPLSRLPRLKVSTASRVEFELPDEEATDPGLSLPAVSFGQTPQEPTESISNFAAGADGFTGRPVILPATVVRESVTLGTAAPGVAPAPPAAPVQYGPAPIALSEPNVVTVPPLPKFARSFKGMLLRTLLFWRPRGECVQLTVFGPRAVAPGENIKLQVFSHTPAAFESVCTLSRAFLQDGEMLGSGFVQQPVVRGTVLGLHLTVVNAGVGKSLLEVTWLGQPQPRSFEVHVPWESPAGTTQGVLSAGLGKLLAGQVEFRFEILPRK